MFGVSRSTNFILASMGFVDGLHIRNLFNKYAWNSLLEEFENKFSRYLSYSPIEQSCSYDVPGIFGR